MATQCWGYDRQGPIQALPSCVSDRRKAFKEKLALLGSVVCIKAKFDFRNKCVWESGRRAPRIVYFGAHRMGRWFIPSDAFTSAEREAGTNWTKRCVGSRARIDALEIACVGNTTPIPRSLYRQSYCSCTSFVCN
jgi:hypothetical protein